METLNLSESTPRTESRLKNLFWPSISNGSDVDSLGVQGYWVCTVVGLFSFVVLVATGHAILGTLLLLFYYLGGVGVREHSIYAAGVVLGCFLLDTIVALSVIRVLLAGLLMSNFRATIIASQWRSDAPEAELPPRTGETWSDKFTDLLPQRLWPKMRVGYYILSGFVVFLSVAGLAITVLRSAMSRP
jgi:hypothetical protein